MMLKFTKYIKKITKTPAVTGTIIVTIGALVGSFFNYLLQVFLGRTLSISDYGVFNALLSLSVILTVISGSLSTALIKTVADIKVEGRYDILTKLFWKLTAAFSIIGVLIFLSIMVFRNPILEFLQIMEPSYVTVFAFYMSLTFVSILAPAFLQGLLRFKSFAFWNVVSSIFRLALPGILVMLGFEVSGVFVGMGISLILSYLISTLLLKKNFTLFKELEIKKYYKRMLLFAGPVIFVNLGMTVLNNLDVILVKHYFSAEMAGLYSGVVTLGKIFLFGAGTVSIVMYPQISNSYARKQNVFKKIEPFLIVQILVLLCGFFAFLVLPELVTRIMFGERYLPSVKYLPRFSVFVGFYVIANFFTMFLLAMNKTKIFVFHIFASLTQLFLISYFHGSIRQIIDMNILSATLLSTFLLAYALRIYYSNKKFSGHTH